MCLEKNLTGAEWVNPPKHQTRWSTCLQFPSELQTKMAVWIHPQHKNQRCIKSLHTNYCSYKGNTSKTVPARRCVWKTQENSPTFNENLFLHLQMDHRIWEKWMINCDVRSLWESFLNISCVFQLVFITFWFYVDSCWSLVQFLF